jgi:uncharacterized membrane protein YczE
MNRDQQNPEESDREKLARRRLGRKPQIGGGIAVFIGVLLLAFVPAVPQARPDIHQMAWIFIAIGISLIAVGTFSRWYFLN